MKLKFLLYGLILLISNSLYAQKFSLEGSESHIPLSISSYAINGVNPGIKIGADYLLNESIKTKIKRNSKSKTISKLWYLNASMALGLEPLSNTNWLTSIEIGRQRTRNYTWYAAPTLGIGALVKYNNGETYEVIASEVTEIGISSRTYFAPSLGMTFGRNYRLGDFDFGVYGRGNGVLAVGMNSTTVPLFSFELGLRFYSPFRVKGTRHQIKKKSK